MTSIRFKILGQLAERLTAETSLTVQHRTTVQVANDPKLAVVTFVGEQKAIAGNDQYNATMDVEVHVRMHLEEADNVEADAPLGTPYERLDELVAEVENAIHDPDEWGITPAFTDVVVLGHAVDDPTDDTTLGAIVRLQFRYRHHYQDVGA